MQALIRVIYILTTFQPVAQQPQAMEVKTDTITSVVTEQFYLENKYLYSLPEIEVIQVDTISKTW